MLNDILFPETSGMSLTGAIDIFAFGEIHIQSKFVKNNSERPVDALALILEKGDSLTHSLTDLQLEIKRC